MAWDLTFLCSSRECQAINPYCAWLQFQLSRCGAVLWITLKSWRGALCCKDTETERQTICPGRNCVGLEKTHILLAKRYLSIRGENSVIRNVNTWIKLPLSLQYLSFPLFLFLFCFGSILMHSLLNLAVEKRGYRESCWACVHGWQRCEMTVIKEDAH